MSKCTRWNSLSQLDALPMYMHIHTHTHNTYIHTYTQETWLFKYLFHIHSPNYHYKTLAKYRTTKDGSNVCYVRKELSSCRPSFYLKCCWRGCMSLTMPRKEYFCRNVQDGSKINMKKWRTLKSLNNISIEGPNRNTVLPDFKNCLLLSYSQQDGILLV